ncbi:MAG: peptidylprolyl isomerase [Chitinophagaceae bacterium]
MKIFKLLIYTLFFFLNICGQAQNIFSYGNSTVSKEEFLKAFQKNNADKHPSAQAYNEYLELYIRFKLKVKAAYDLKMDTLTNQKAELNDFRNQVAVSYLNDETSFQNLVQEAFTRSQKDIHLAHIFIALDSAGGTTPANSDSKDTTRAWKIALTIYNQLQKGADFAKLASSYSSDASAQSNGGDIGYITLFTLPYVLENLAYSTPVGTFSKPFLSRTGYHIFKNIRERKAAGKMKAAQLVFVFSPDTLSKPKSMTKQKADSVYKLLSQGASFNEMVDRFSDDINAKATHGEMPEFGVGSFDSQFEILLFALDKNGAFTQPILTPGGYYIIKRLGQSPVNSDPQNDSAMNVLRQLVRNDSRMEVARRALLQKMYKLTGFKKTALPESTLLSFTENSFGNKKTIPLPGISNKTIVFSFPKQKADVDDFIKFVQNGRYIQNGKLVPAALTQFEETTVQEYYRIHLDEYNADFAAQLKEFKEGNLLFEIMQHNIWDKASADSSGLKTFYENNKNKYWWNASADAIIFSSADSATAVDLKGNLEKNLTGWRDIVTSYQARAQADSGRFELAQLPLRQQTPAPNLLTKPLRISDDSSTSFIHIIKLYPEKQPRNFEDAKGFVLNDYQDYLENKWIAHLKKKYAVKINEPVFQSLLKSP